MLRCHPSKGKGAARRGGRRAGAPAAVSRRTIAGRRHRESHGTAGPAMGDAKAAAGPSPVREVYSAAFMSVAGRTAFPTSSA